MFYFYRNTLKLGTGYWTVGSLLLGVVFLLKAIIPDENHLATAAFLNVNTIADYLYLSGILQFKERKINLWIFIGISILDILQNIIFFEIYPSPRIPYGLHSVSLIIFGLLAIIKLMRLDESQRNLKKIFLPKYLKWILNHSVTQRYSLVN